MHADAWRRRSCGGVPPARGGEPAVLEGALSGAPAPQSPNAPSFTFWSQAGATKLLWQEGKPTHKACRSLHPQAAPSAVPRIQMHRIRAEITCRPCRRLWRADRSVQNCVALLGLGICAAGLVMNEVGALSKEGKAMGSLEEATTHQYPQRTPQHASIASSLTTPSRQLPPMPMPSGPAPTASEPEGTAQHG